MKATSVAPRNERERKKVKSTTGAGERRSPAPVVDFAFFRSRSFLGATLVAFTVSFAMLAMFFFLALYMQDILRYSALEAGVRFLPSTVVIIFTAPIAGRLADRIGPKPLMAAGLALASVALFLQSMLDASSGYAQLLPAFMIMGLGMGLTMSPMSTAAMNAVSPDKAGGASGILSMSRMVGGTFGVAAIGALFQSLSKNRLAADLAGSGLSPSQHARIADALSSGKGGRALHGLAPEQAAQAGRAMRDAFVHALSGSLKLSAGVAAAGVVLVLLFVERGLSGQHAHPAGEAQAAEPTAPVAEAA